MNRRGAHTQLPCQVTGGGPSGIVVVALCLCEPEHLALAARQAIERQRARPFAARSTDTRHGDLDVFRGTDLVEERFDAISIMAGEDGPVLGVRSGVDRFGGNEPPIGKRLADLGRAVVIDQQLAGRVAARPTCVRWSRVISATS